MRLYTELADWYPLLSPPDDYQDEANWLADHLSPGSVLELGCGSGCLLHWLPDYERVMTDVSPRMLALSQDLNPDAEHHLGDMRTLRLGRRFDNVLVHDAVAYMLTEADLAAVLATAAAHLRPGGTLVAMPDWLDETFHHDVSVESHDAEDGRAMRTLEWAIPDPTNPNLVHVHFAFMARHADGRVEHFQDHHHEGIFPRATWLRLLDEAGFDAQAIEDDWDREVFICTLREGA